MSTLRLQARVAGACPVATGYVEQRRFVFHKRSVDGSAKADAAYSASRDDRVWGVVFDIPKEQKRLLEEFEFLGIGYDQAEVEVVHRAGVLRAWMYVARQDSIDTSLLPYCWYRDLILDGAREHELPSEYIQRLSSFATLRDADAARHSANQRLLRNRERNSA